MRKMKILSVIMGLMLSFTGCSEAFETNDENENDSVETEQSEAEELADEEDDDKDEDADEDEDEDSENEKQKKSREDIEIVYKISPDTKREEHKAEREQYVGEEQNVVKEVHSENDSDNYSSEFENYGASNLVNSGICVSDGESFYYCDTNEKKLYRKVSGDKELVAQNINSYYMNLDGNMIYYADADSDNNITALNLDSGEREVIFNKHAKEINLYGGMLYFWSAGDDGTTIYRMNTDGSGLEALASSENLWYFTVYKDKIYYVDFEDESHAVVAMNLDGSGRDVIRSSNASDLCIAEDRIFFAARDTRYLYSMNLDGTDVKQLNSTYSRCVNYMDGRIYYYTDDNDNNTMYSCDLNGNVTGRYMSGVRFILLMENEAYYFDSDSNLYISSLD